MTIVAPQVEWRVGTREAVVDFDAELHREQWQLYLSVASLWRDRRGYRGQAIYKAVADLGSDQIGWVESHQPFLYCVWQGGARGVIQPISQNVVFTGDQFLEETRNIARSVKDFDRLFFRSQLISALIAIEATEGHTKFFGEGKRIYDKNYHSY